MAISIVRVLGPYFKDNAANPTSGTVAASQAGNAIIHVLAGYSNATIDGFSDSAGNTYVLDRNTTLGNHTVAIGSCLNPAPATSFTATAPTDYWAYWIVEVSGLAGTGAHDSAMANTAFSLSGVSRANIVASAAIAQAEELILSVMGFNGGQANENIVGPGGYTTNPSSDGTVHEVGAISYKVSSGIETPSLSWSYVSSGAWTAAIAAYRGVTGSSATVTPSPAVLSLTGKSVSAAPFNYVRIRQVLVNESGTAVANATGISVVVWYSGVPVGAPDVSLSSQTTDASGSTSWSIATGSLSQNQAVFLVAFRGSPPSTYACGRLVPSYE